MTDHPILFSAPMVRAILDGRKTMTRRVLKPQPVMRGDNDCVITYERGKHTFSGPPDFLIRDILPTYGLRWRPGDRLWVKETYYLTDDGDHTQVVYAADDIAVRDHIAGVQEMQRKHGLSDDWIAPHLKKRPSIYMPRWASRITLAVEAVRVERLQDISEGDAEREGAEPTLVSPDGGSAPHVEGFCEIWASIHGADAWDANPWVSVTTFRRIEA